MDGKVLVTGGAGFIGSSLVDKLMLLDYRVKVIDNLSSGRKENINYHLNRDSFEFIEADLLKDDISQYFEGVDEVWHLAANPNVKSGLSNTKDMIDQNILVTYNVLEAMRKNNVKKINFTSSSVVYGEAKTIPTPENYSPLMPISLYGASKLASEALISAYSSSFGIKGTIFRLANVVGPRSDHGVIHDFVMKLDENKNTLNILGDGNQKKSYIYVDDCVEAMVLASNSEKDVDVFNVGSNDYISVKEIAETVSKAMGLQPVFEFGSEDRGWKGDVPVMLLATDKIKSLGWKLNYNSLEAVKLTAEKMISSGNLN
ncbi:NAD-dependent epimerase/dehydratase family protein [Candidatus Parvarchaeota archaeon]|uniref:NAD-dependent epimerase/dehydratase family protein n=1 Tax=Candidatus Acidifodinimicrobium mancum TaxID=2898728 RepID=A0A8T3UZM4_9ARCH|nr:NAD-dependent epimerase/dehydratase family protein [Candidatus Acidifodinimicrobium mancum]